VKGLLSHSMDRSSSSRPVRRHAHICRVCNSAFTCKPELLEHEQEAHTAGSGSNSSVPSSKWRSVSALADGSDSAGSSPVRIHGAAKKANMNWNQPVNAIAAAVNLLVDHEEVYESCRMVKSADVMMQKTAADSTVSVQQKFASRGGSSSVAKQMDSTLAENRQASSFRTVARSHDQVVDQIAEDAGGFVHDTSVVSQSSGSQSRLLSQAKVTAVQNRAPLHVAGFYSSGKGTEANKSPKGDVIKALGLERKGCVKDTTTITSSETSDNDGVDEDDTKPPVSDSSTDICVSAVDSRNVARYEVLGSINEEPVAHVSNSDLTARRNRDVGMKSVLLPALTKEEAADCVAGLHHGDSYTASVNNDELQLLAAVSSTRSRDIVVKEPESPSPVPAEEEQQQMTDIVMSDPTDIVEQEVELETTMCHSEPRRLSGRQTKRSASGSKSPVCLVKLPMTPPPQQFTSTDGAKKRMVAITVARAPRMVSVLLRNRGTDEQEPQETSAEASVEKNADRNTEDKSDVVTSSAESGSAASVSAEAATAAQAIAFNNDSDMVNEVAQELKFEVCTDCKLPFPSDKIAEHLALNHVRPETEVCLYCEQLFPSDELAEHISMDHVCDQCGRKFRQPANLRKVIYTVGYILHASVLGTFVILCL